MCHTSVTRRAQSDLQAKLDAAKAQHEADARSVDDRVAQIQAVRDVCCVSCVLESVVMRVCACVLVRRAMRCKRSSRQRNSITRSVCACACVCDVCVTERHVDHQRGTRDRAEGTRCTTCICARAATGKRPVSRVFYCRTSPTQSEHESKLSAALRNAERKAASGEAALQARRDADVAVSCAVL
jgi:hypothetical protein